MAVRGDSASKQQKDVKNTDKPQVHQTEKRSKDPSTEQGR